MATVDVGAVEGSMAKEAAKEVEVAAVKKLDGWAVEEVGWAR